MGLAGYRPPRAHSHRRPSALLRCSALDIRAAAAAPRVHGRPRCSGDRAPDASEPALRIVLLTSLTSAISSPSLRRGKVNRGLFRFLSTLWFVSGFLSFLGLQFVTFLVRETEIEMKVHFHLGKYGIYGKVFICGGGCGGVRSP